MKKFLVVLFWFFSLIIVIIYTYENPERFNVIKDHFKKNTAPQAKLEKGPIQTAIANSFSVKFSKLI